MSRKRNVCTAPTRQMPNVSSSATVSGVFCLQLPFGRIKTAYGWIRFRKMPVRLTTLYHRHRRLLGLHRERPRRRRTAEQRDAPFHSPPCKYFGSALGRKNDAEQHPFVLAYLPGSADMSAAIRRYHIVDLVFGNRGPFAVHFDLVMVADHAALRRTTVHEVAAGASAVVSLQG
jgi:hypothetical protein